MNNRQNISEKLHQLFKKCYLLVPQLPVLLSLAAILHGSIGIKVDFIATTIRNITTVWPLLVTEPIRWTTHTAAVKLNSRYMICFDNFCFNEEHYVEVKCVLNTLCRVFVDKKKQQHNSSKPIEEAGKHI